MPVQEKIIRGHCPECGPNKNAELIAEHESKWEYEDESIWGQIDYRILKCRGCDSIYFQKAEAFSEHTDHVGDYIISYSYWPSPLKRERPAWLSDLSSVDIPLHSILNEVYVALDNDLAVISATGMRTAFDRATELLGVDPAKTFQEKLGDLFSAGKVGEMEKTTLGVLADAGGAAAHRGWMPEPRQLATMMDIVEAFCYRNLILVSQVDKLKPHIPAKQKRRPAGESVD